MGINARPDPRNEAPAGLTPERPSVDDPDGLADPHAELERALTAEFLARRGHTLQSVRQLPPAESIALLRQARAFATLRLSEVEARAHYLDELDGG
jgi:hypothetical protein